MHSFIVRSNKIPSILMALLLVAPASITCAAQGPVMDGDAALAKLMQGNRRYVSAAESSPKPLAHQRVAVAKKQRPFAAIVACSDSRVAPELVFDRGLGDLFVIRIAGNVVDSDALGSLEYAVEHLGVRLVVVLGHQRCGAVEATLKGGELGGHVRGLARAIEPAVKKARSLPGDPLEVAIQENAREMAAKIQTSKPALSQLAGGPVKIVAAEYSLDSGVVRILH